MYGGFQTLNGKELVNTWSLLNYLYGSSYETSVNFLEKQAKTFWADEQNFKADSLMFSHFSENEKLLKILNGEVSLKYLISSNAKTLDVFLGSYPKYIPYVEQQNSLWYWLFLNGAITGFILCNNSNPQEFSFHLNAPF